MAFEKTSNKFPMKEYHIQHMEKTILRFVMGLPENPSKLQKRNHEKYFGRLTYVCKEIEYDILHGVKIEEVLSTLNNMRNYPSILQVKDNEDLIRRLNEIEERFIKNRST
ncbi:MAG: hypothetical protein ACM31J_01555 [Nitrososphaerales archaeon]|jgi:hypothetical protein|nr:hypothetical protein [Nitrososphaeraceae archaeon]